MKKNWKAKNIQPIRLENTKILTNYVQKHPWTLHHLTSSKEEANQINLET